MNTRMTEELSVLDPEVYAAIQQEDQRQDDNLELIASENYTSRAIMLAQGSSLTNKYAEGYPGKRYYAGCECVDIVENLAIDRLKSLYGADHANVQPHSGSQANQAVFYTVLQAGDTVLGMSLADGGHLTHGSSVNISGRYFQSVAYGVSPDTGLIDYDQVRQLALSHRPRLIIAGASSYTRVIDWAFFAALAQEIGAVFMADMAHYSGLIAAKVYPSPVGLADFVTSTTHKTLRGPRGGVVMTKAAHATALDGTVFPGMQGGPLMHVIAGKAICFQEAARPEFVSYQEQVIRNARAMADVFLAHGLTLVSGGTDCHMLLLDVRSFGLNGRQSQDLLRSVGITLNRNAVPNDPEKPWITSGIRIGTPALTTRGMGEQQARWIAETIIQVLSSAEEASVHDRIRTEVLELCHAFLPYSQSE